VTASNYDAIREDHVKGYGTQIRRYGPRLVKSHYAVRSHFIYELLQNAEDAMAKRRAWQGSRSITFRLASKELRVSHYGALFTDADVRSISCLADSTKEESSIGRFGIGFKSVHEFTDRPEVHSGDEHFAIEIYVYPVAVPPVRMDPEETVFVIPLRDGDPTADEEIEAGLRQLGARTLLFLREIEEIEWSVDGGASGSYLRVTDEQGLRGMRRVTLLSRETGQQELEETWTVFSREVRSDQNGPLGHVEIAFLNESDSSGHTSVKAISESPLVVWFPTVVPTYLGFLVQGPYNTTDNRDNVLVGDLWNDYLVQETAKLLVEALRWLRDHDMLDTAVLECLPLDPMQFAEDRMFGPLFEVVRHVLIAEPLMPCFGGGYVAASQAKIARTQELRELLNPYQLGVLYRAEGDLRWLSGDISQDRTPDLRQYVTQVLKVDEVTPEAIVPKLNKQFLECQSDDWMVRLYEFLNGQTALLKQGKLAGLPLIRLEDGTHVAAGLHDGQPSAFLPSDSDTGFPTVRRVVCATGSAKEFLVSLGLAEIDPVDVVLQKVVPRYACSDVDVSDDQYEQDTRRMLAAWHTDSTSRREKLLSVLRETSFVRTRECATNEVRWARPGDAYFATDRLRELFAGVPGVLLVDDASACLQEPDGVKMLRDCGVAERLRPVSCEPHFGYKELLGMRRMAGHERSTEDVFYDWLLMGLQEVLSALPSRDADAGAIRAELLWNALCDAENHGDLQTLKGTYKWKYYYSWYTHPFDAAYIKQLNDSAWVPNEHGSLQMPVEVPFGTTGWSENEHLLSIVHFKPAVVEDPSELAGVELEALDLLRELGLTTATALRARLGIKSHPETAGPSDVATAIKELLGGAPGPTPPAPVLTGVEQARTRSSGMDGGAGTAGTARPHGDIAADGQTNSRTEGSGEGGGKRTPGSIGGRPFISYVGVQPDDEDTDPDGLDQQARLALEEKAVSLITDVEPGLHRTPVDNPGYDLFEASEEGHMVRWVEVKAMTGDLHGRPVGLSRTQFEWAREHGDAYWLYVVEHADSPSAAHIVQIQDPAGKARTFTFDHGWLSVAQLSDSTLPDERKQSEEG
jgi:hypothetical protein